MDDLQQHTSRASEVLSAAAEAEEEKPVRCKKFRQQELWAWKPVWSPTVVVIMYLIVAAVFIPLGVVVYIQSRNLVSTPRLRYDQDPDCDVGPGPFDDPPPEKTCFIRVEIEEDVTGPLYFYYGLVNFYQNARTYVTSRSDPQLRGRSVSLSGVRDVCDPLVEDPETGGVLFPCGLVANSKFNDSFTLCRTRACDVEDEVSMNGTGIAWDIDRERRFRRSPQASEEDNNKTVASEDFMVWMRVAAYRNWKKLYRIIEDGLEEGTYWVKITSSYPVESFNGEKFFFISETTWFGGPNEILGLSYVAVGAVALVLAIAFLIRSRAAQDLDLPPETTILLDGISPDPKLTSVGHTPHDDRPGVSNA